jgi:Flp pilus assembly CpaF family ATPase
MLSDVDINTDLYHAYKQKALSGHLERVLEYHRIIYPFIEALLNPQNHSPQALRLQNQLNISVRVGFEELSDLESRRLALFDAKYSKSLMLAAFIDELFADYRGYGLNFNSSPSVIDKSWVKTLLIHDFIYYGPVTFLIVARILQKYENITANPIHILLQDLILDSLITEVRVNNSSQIFFEANNKIFAWPIPFLSDEHLLTIIERMVSENNILTNACVVLNSASPIADFEHPCGFIRGAAVISPASELPFVTLRIHPDVPYTLDQLVSLGMLDNPMKEFLSACQQAGTTVAIAGTMGSGKTTILSALSEHWPDNGRKATIEDTPELRPRIQDLIKMRTIEHDKFNPNNIDVALLTKACKRHSVRYVVLSEARDAAAWEILQLSQSILGSLLTFHYTVRGERHLVDQALNTLVALCKQHPLAPANEEIKHLIASMIQILLLIEQDPIDGIRRVVRIYKINGFDPMNGGHFKYVELFKHSREEGFKPVSTCMEFEKYLYSKGVEYKFPS